MQRVRQKVSVLFSLSLAACRPDPLPVPAPVAPPMPAKRFGELMTEVGRRFERVGRAASAERWRLVSYDLAELQELFDDDLTDAVLPPDAPRNLQAMARSFATSQLPVLAKAATGTDKAAFAQAFSQVATACNACHAASARGFLVVPSGPGAAVPSLDAP